MIAKTYLKSLRLMAFVQVMKNVQSFLAKETDLETLGLADTKKVFDKAFTSLEDAVHQSRKNEQTETILELDSKRDILLMNFITHCKIYQTHPDTAKSEAAKRSIIQIEAYGKNPQRRAYRDETAIIRNIVADFSQSQPQQDITLIGAKEWLDLLAPLNEQFDVLHSNRTVQESEKELGKAKQAREEMQKQFDYLCKAITAMAFVKGETAYQPLANAINEEVKNALVSFKNKRQV